MHSEGISLNEFLNINKWLLIFRTESFHLDDFVSSKFPHLRLREITCDYRKTNVSSMCPCLVQILDDRYHIGPQFFNKEAAEAVNVTGASYRDITQFFLPKLDNIDVDGMWFQ
ncbi:hypothetical protein TNCT_101981 [Trichonephila clavata]|uniref:Uncharacterized protein n=1 Tax=Trichonephila clavata TaxID=2740835 RepID=A0A8X6HG35_TRICU|nr:hypothetical protein TNCT_101981 [Trichonephila clavata]